MTGSARSYSPVHVLDDEDHLAIDLHEAPSVWRYAFDLDGVPLRFITRNK